MVKKYVCTFIFFALTFLVPSVVKAQVPKFYLRTGYGYFANINQLLRPGFGDVPSYIQINPKVEGEAKNGSSAWFDFGYRLNTGFTINGGISLAETKYNYNDGLGFYWDYRQSDSYKIFDLSFGKEIKMNHVGINLNLGMIYQHYFTSFADYDVNPGPNPTVAFPTIIEFVANDLGMSFKVDGEYNFKNNLFIGLRAGTHLIFAIGFDNIFLSPTIGMKL